MLYLVIGLVVFVALGAFFRQTKHGGHDGAGQSHGAQGGAAHPSSFDALVADASETSGKTPGPTAPGGLIPPAQSEAQVPAQTQPAEQSKSTAQPPVQPKTQSEGISKHKPQEKPEPLNPVLSAAPISSPSAVNSATYSTVAPTALKTDSPYSYSSSEELQKPHSDPSLLRWCGRTGSLQIGEFILHGPVTYWSDGPSKTPEPCCIDITLPVEFPDPDTGSEDIVEAFPPESSVSYAEMSPQARGFYLTWLAGGRIQPPPHASCPLLWFYGVERRTLVDKLDLGVCLAEVFRLLPLLRWEPLRQAITHFAIWLSAKIWLPEEELLGVCRSLPQVPQELFNLILKPYADTKLPLPSAVAFTLMRASALLYRTALEDKKDPSELENMPFIPHSQALLERFVPLYKNTCSGGLILRKPKTSMFLACSPTNPSLASEKGASASVLELPDFFTDLTDFAPLFPVWRDFLRTVQLDSTQTSAAKEAESLADRPDLEGFVQTLKAEMPKREGAEETGSTPVLTDLAALGDVMNIEHGGPEEKARGGDRRKIVEVARVEGYLVLPDLGVSGKEYRWGDPIALVPLELGERLSDHYNSSALLLEFASAATGASTSETVKTYRTHLDDYFSLSSDDHKRLLALEPLLLRNPPDPKSLGEFFQLCFQTEEREVLERFLTRFLKESGGKGPEEDLRVLLDLPPIPLEPEPNPEEDGKLEQEKNPLELGEEVASILAPLFRE